MADNNLLDFPIIALSESTKTILSNSLNPKKVLGTKGKNLSRDWRGLAHFCGITGKSIPSLSIKDDKISNLLDIMHKNNKNINDLCNYLKEMDRWDVIDDINENLNNDIEIYKKRMKKDNSDFLENDVANSILTYDDLQKVHEGKELQKYDAFFLYADDDDNFAQYVINSLEKLYVVRICDIKRDVIIDDLLTMKKIIRERCNHVVVILSHALLNSNLCNELVQFTDALAIERKKRIIVPISMDRLEHINLPDSLCFKRILNYTEYHKNEYKIRSWWKTIGGSLLIHHKLKNNNENIAIDYFENFNICHVKSEENNLNDDNDHDDNVAIVEVANDSLENIINFNNDKKNDSIEQSEVSENELSMVNNDNYHNNHHDQMKNKKSILKSVVKKCSKKFKKKKKTTLVIDESTEIPSLPSVKDFEAPGCDEMSSNLTITTDTKKKEGEFEDIAVL